MTTDNEALKLAERHGTKLPQITSKDATYHIVFEPEEIIACINEAIQTGRDQVWKELAEMEPVGYQPKGIYMDGRNRIQVSDEPVPLIPQPNMPKKGE